MFHDSTRPFSPLAAFVIFKEGLGGSRFFLGSSMYRGVGGKEAGCCGTPVLTLEAEAPDLAGCTVALLPGT